MGADVEHEEGPRPRQLRHEPDEPIERRRADRDLLRHDARVAQLREQARDARLRGGGGEQAQAHAVLADQLMVDHRVFGREGQHRLQLERQHLREALLRREGQLDRPHRRVLARDGDDDSVRRSTDRGEHLADRARERIGAPRGPLDAPVLRRAQRRLDVALELHLSKSRAQHRAAYRGRADIEPQYPGHARGSPRT